MGARTGTVPNRDAFYAKIATHNLAPLWESLHDLVPAEPRPACVPALWRYAAIRDFIMESGDIISAKEAVRRVLILENPGLRGTAAITQSLYAGLQLILPGEIAPSHRHTQSALRFIVEGSGAYTTVDGEKTVMRPGDFVITPSWTWHDHGNESGQPMVWLDGLDIPMVRFFDAGFAENLDQDVQPLERPEGDSPARYGRGLVPVDFEVSSKTSPVFNYPYAEARESLEILCRTGDWDPCHGLKMRYINPVTGDWAMPTIGTFLQLLPKGFKSRPYQSTDGTVFCVIEGCGRSVVGDATFEWEAKDIFVVPSWARYRLEADDEAVLFSYSDRPVQEKLGFWRQRRGND